MTGPREPPLRSDPARLVLVCCDWVRLLFLGTDRKVLNAQIPSSRYPDLREWMIEFQRRVHSPPTLLDPDHPGHFDLVINNGSNEGINLVCSFVFASISVTIIMV